MSKPANNADSSAPSLPVYQVARQAVQSAERLLQHAARGDQDKMLEHALLTMAHAAIVANRLGDPVARQLLNSIWRETDPDDESWNARARARARLERELQA